MMILFGRWKKKNAKGRNKRTKTHCWEIQVEREKKRKRVKEKKIERKIVRMNINV